MDQYLTNFGPSSEASKVKELAIRSRVNVYSVVRFPERVRQYQGEENSVGASTHPCFTPLCLRKGSEEEQSNGTVPCIEAYVTINPVTQRLRDIKIHRAWYGYLESQQENCRPK